MSKLKSILIDFYECEASADAYAHIHPAFHDALKRIAPEPDKAQNDLSKVNQVYGLYINNILSQVYLHKDAADYDCWVCRSYEYTHAERYEDDAYHYEVRPVTFNPLTYDQLRNIDKGE